MASKKKNRRKGPQPSAAAPVVKPRPKQQPAKHGQPVRETVEALVIAFVLAFLFRTFQAEMFVIPTGSMAPTLMGRHEDLHCEACGYRYKLGDNLPKPEQVQRHVQSANQGGVRVSPQEVVDSESTIAGKCPTCRRTMVTKPIRGNAEYESAATQRAYSGDRIVVNKYLYSFQDPERWDVVVFKYPGNAVENYIKRLVGLPGEQLQIEQGDVFARTEADAPYGILRKPADKILAMRQLVHDTDHDPTPLRKAGYPLRWEAATEQSAWTLEETLGEHLVQQRYKIEADGDTTDWLRYHHRPPGAEVWGKVGRTNVTGEPVELEVQPRLITDFNAYNTAVTVGAAAQRHSIEPPLYDQGLHWVGDLILEAEVKVDSADGVLTLELVEAGCKYRAEFDVGTGEVTISATGPDADSPADAWNVTSATPLKGRGEYAVRMANVDDQIVLWVNGRVVSLPDDGAYDVTALVEERGDLIPRSTEQDPGDLSPAAIGGSNLTATVTRLAVYRDIYYIADKSPPSRVGSPVTDYDLVVVNGELSVRADGDLVSLAEMLTDPESWDAYRQRRAQEFSLTSDSGEQLLFVMGDNSAASLDARLWPNGNGALPGRPGGHYLERSLLIGKAVCVYWPHSFDRIPGTSIWFPLFPNFGDMRLVR